MKILVVAEKPSVAADLARVLGKFKKHKDYLENESYVVSSSLGHVVELFMPQDMDSKLGHWSFENLPIIPQKFQLKPIEKTKERFLLLKQLLAREDVGEVINACDAGREGELIFAYIYELAQCQKPVKRLWLSSMTQEGIQTAFQRLREDNEVKLLREAARCRSEADWLVGINGTRAVTLRMYGNRNKGKLANIASVGRVQTPTLTLVCEREKAIRNFSPRLYWILKGTFTVTNGTYEGVYQNPKFKKGEDSEDRVDRIWDKKFAENLRLEIEQAEAPFPITEKKKHTTQAPQRLYDLTLLQREANNRFGFSADRTLKIAQALYERHKVLTYPRTDSKALPEDYAKDECKKVLSKLGGDLKPLAEEVIKNHWIQASNKRIFNNKEVTDHSAIIPTGNTNTERLSEDESKIYDMVARRFIAAFYPSAEYDVTTRITQIKEHSFKTEGKVLVNPGWLVVYGKVATAKDALVAIDSADGHPPAAKSVNIELKEEQTTPPPRYTEATLLAAMESAGKLVEDEELAEAMKERGLGTPATRAQIIEHLIKLQYMERAQRELIPTSKAENLLEFINAIHIESLTSPSMTGEWEHRLRQIQEGQYTREAFMEGIVKVTTQIVESTKSFKEMLENANQTHVIAPSDGKPLLETPLSYRSQDGKYIVYKYISQRRMTEEEIQELLNNRTIGPLEGFKSRMGKPFSATLQLDETNKVRFIFENSNKTDAGGSFGASSLIEDLKSYPVVGECPCCRKGNVYATPGTYLCEHNQASQEPCNFRVSHVLLGRIISEDQFAKLLSNRRTDLLDKFKSKRTGKYFSAYLVLKSKGDIGFEFEEKRDKDPQKAAASKKTEVAKAGTDSSEVSSAGASSHRTKKTSEKTTTKKRKKEE